MFRHVLIGAAILILFGAINVAAGPKLTISENEFDFGYAPQKAKLSHTFWVKSTGDEVLKISKVIPGCGCTKAPMDKKIIAPGDSARLEIIFSTRNYKGAIQKSPRIESNTLKGKTFVNIRTNIVQGEQSTKTIVFSPPILNLTKDKLSENNEISFDISNVNAKDLQLKLIDWPGELFEVSIPENIPAGETIKATITLDKDILGESFEKSLTFEINNDTSDRFTLPIRKQVFLVTSQN
ncbi:MAG: DUF1573 domain-containing protein [candidate division Zixibacteria bacterium]